MKKLIIIIFLSILYMSNSQDYEPNHYLIEWGGLTTDRPLDVDSFNIDGFKLGFQWSGSSQMSNALRHNIIHGGTSNSHVFDSNFVEDMHVIRQPDVEIWNMSFIQYEPTLLTSDYKDFITKYSDTTNSIFGFNNIHGTVYNSSFSGDLNYDRLLLYKDSLSSYPADKVVLSDITPKDKFFTISKGGQLSGFDGEKWNLSINLRKNIDTVDEFSDDIVLVIKLPYKAININGDTTETYIRFDSIPETQISSRFTELDYFEDRGISLNTYEYVGSNYMDSIVITKRMLPRNLNKPDITISAHFSCFSFYDTVNNHKRYNPRFKPGFEDETSQIELIDEIDIEVKYYGNADIAIDWIRIENDKAQKVLRGEYDAQDRSQIESYLNSIQNATKNGIPLYNLHRFYNQDTESNNPAWWGQARYMNRVTNGLTLTRDYPEPPEAYRYYTKAEDIWIGFGYDKGDDVLMPAPYTRVGHQNGSTMGLKTGYGEITDSLNSNMETELRHNEGVNTWDDLLIDTNYVKQLEDDALQARFEKNILKNIYNPIRNGFLFADYEWYFYDLLYNIKPKLDTSIHHYIKSLTYSTSQRVKTFEEHTMLYYYVLMNGCTGFIIDGDNNKNYNMPFDQWKSGNMGIGDYNELDGTNDIYSNEVGDDFVNQTYDTWNAYQYSFLSTYSANMQIPEDRMYIGTKSIRDALFQFNTYIRANEDELYNLDLVSTMSKGYRLHYLQDTASYGVDTMLTNFVSLDTSETFTTRLFKKSFSDFHLEEPFDSTFINMTMMKHKDYDLDSVFYIGIQNRRTDPLIYWTNPDSLSQKYLRFLSSAEFRDSCMNSPDSLLYQDYWWKRLGARKVTIPFNYTYSDTNTYNLLKISEIGSDVDSLNQLWHRGEKYYDMVTDTVIGENRSLSFNLLPGQGKILKVEVLKSDTVAGFLDNYNQTKLISYEDPTNPNMIRYHLVYHRISPKPSDPSKTYTEVQYIQSMPIEKNSQQENIEWNRATRRDLSDMFLASLTDPDRYADPNCNKPSIVVRDSADKQFAYVVYTCADSIVTHDDSSRVVYAKIDTEFGNVVFNKQIYHSATNNIYEYGTPVINASANGNYVAWTDSTVGLLVGFDDLVNNIVYKVDTVENTHVGSNDFAIKYPSFNTYSHIENGEDNAGLVWYQGSPAFGGIYYSRVKDKGTFPYDTLLWSNEYNFNSVFSKNGPPSTTYKTILIGGSSIETKPIIYRNLRDYDVTPPYNCVRNRIDNINWLDRNNGIADSIGKFVIDSYSIFHRDTNHSNQFWAITGEKYTFSKDTITSINSAQQDGISIGGNYSNIGGDFNLNYTLGTSIYQEPGYFGSLFLRSDTLHGTDVDYVANSPTLAAVGKNVHLAKSPKINANAQGNMWKNRRVFETSELDDYDNSIIQSSANLFYKSAFDNKIIKHSFIGFNSDSNNIYFDIPVLEDETEPISSKTSNVSGDFGTGINPCLSFEFAPARSSVSELYIEDIQLVDNDNDGDKEMELTMYGSKNDDIKLFLMRNSDSTTMALTTPTSTTYPSNGTKLIYSILDSTGSAFTLIYEQNDTLASFTEKSFLGGLSTDDTVSYKSSIKNDPVKYILDFDNGANFVANNSDLLDFSVYPNPVSNTVTIQAILPETLNGNRLKNTLLELSITDITGRTILNQMVASGQVVNFDMTNYSKGAYNVKMRYTGSNEFEAVRKIIKE